MTSTVQLQRALSDVKRHVGSPTPRYLDTLMYHPEQGGPYGYCKIKIVGHTFELEPATEAEELTALRGLYTRTLQQHPHLRRHIPTFEAYLAHERLGHRRSQTL